MLLFASACCSVLLLAALPWVGPHDLVPNAVSSDADTDADADAHMHDNIDSGTNADADAD